MDALLASLGKLLGAFTQPVQIVLLFMIAGLAAFCWRLVKFIMDTYERGIASDIKMTTALENLTIAFKERK